ncbi:bZIP transcription factor, partial [archaeon]
MDQSIASSSMSQDDERRISRNASSRSMSVGSDTHDSDEPLTENPENKAERNRERNREHAKRTRLRKKEMIEGMKVRLLELQREVPMQIINYCC